MATDEEEDAKHTCSRTTTEETSLLGSHEKSVGANAFEYYFEQPCAGPPPQKGPPMLTCEQREQVRERLVVDTNRALPALRRVEQRLLCGEPRAARHRPPPKVKWVDG